VVTILTSVQADFLDSCSQQSLGDQPPNLCRGITSSNSISSQFAR
jgi:hypothetical protein